MVGKLKIATVRWFRQWDAMRPSLRNFMAEQAPYLLVLAIIVCWQASWWILQAAWPREFAAPVVLGDVMRLDLCIFLLGFVSGGKCGLRIMRRQTVSSLETIAGFPRPDIGPDEPPPWGDADTLCKITHVVRIDVPLQFAEESGLGRMQVFSGIAQIPCMIHPTHPDRDLLGSLARGEQVVWVNQNDPVDRWGRSYTSYMRFFSAGIMPRSA